MTQLYTVRMKRKQIVVKFRGPGGRERTEETRLIDQIYTGLPYQTALGYRTQFPDAQVKIELEIPDQEPRSRSKHRLITPGIAEYNPRRKSVEKPEAETKPDDTSTHDYAALVNTMVKESVE